MTGAMSRRADVDPFTRTIRDVQLQRFRHPPDGIFERVYAALLDLEGGAEDLDVSDLRRRLEAFRANIPRLPSELAPERWELLANGLAGAIAGLEAGRPDLARAELDAGLRRYIMGPVVG